jgi:hypothetical protein
MQISGNQLGRNSGAAWMNDVTDAAVRYRSCRLYALADVPDPGLRFSDLARGAGHFSQHLKDQYYERPS